MIRYSNLLDYLIGNYLPILLINYWKIYKWRKIRYVKKFCEKKEKDKEDPKFIQINIGTNCENKRVTGYSKIEIESLWRNAAFLNNSKLKALNSYRYVFQ